jgi:UDP-N-acetylmuramyl tripeptide synthase
MMSGLRSTAAVLAAKAAAYGSRRLGRGGGTALSGLVGLQLEPRLVDQLAPQLGLGSIIVTGTNGKTTTSMLIAESVKQAGHSPVANASGSNLLRGIASTLALASSAAGRIPDAANRLGVFEVDEATVPLLVDSLNPRAIVFLNLFRDQLDRFGEVDAVAALWRSMVAKLPTATTLVLNADDPAIALLGDVREKAVYFGVNDAGLGSKDLEHASDSRSCLCGTRLEYDVAFFGQAGHWRCPSCGRKRPTPDVSATEVDLKDGRRLSFCLQSSEGGREVELALGGLYNVYNALAAVAAARALELPLDASLRAVSAAGAAFGRQEAFDVDGRRAEMYLGKNPAGVNQVISTLLLDPYRKTLLIALNDNVADGRDISWVWDADFERLAGFFERVVVGGTRAEEMALRLKYAEWDQATLIVVPGLEPALVRALDLTPEGESLTVVPTYTAMLTLRDLLARRAGKAAFWSNPR